MKSNLQDRKNFILFHDVRFLAECQTEMFLYVTTENVSITITLQYTIQMSKKQCHVIYIFRKLWVILNIVWFMVASKFENYSVGGFLPFLPVLFYSVLAHNLGRSSVHHR